MGGRWSSIWNSQIFSCLFCRHPLYIQPLAAFERAGWTIIGKIGRELPVTHLLYSHNLLSWKKHWASWSRVVLDTAGGSEYVQGRVSGQSWPFDLRLSLWSRGQCSILVIALLPIFGRSQPIFALFSDNSHSFLPISAIWSRNGLL